MKCIILAAGYATRLYPLTENFPKPLLPVGAKSILDWLVDDIDTAGLVDEYIVVSNHKFSSAFTQWGQIKAQRITVLDDGTSSNETRLGAVRDIQFAIDRLKLEDDLLVIAGDNVLDFSLTTFLRYAQKKRTACVLRYYEPDAIRLHSCGVLELGDGDRVLSMEEKPAYPRSHWCCPPFYYYTRETAALVAQGIAAGCATDAPGSYIAWLCGHAVVHAMEMPGNRYDVGTLKSYRKICETYRGIATCSCPISN